MLYLKYQLLQDCYCKRVIDLGTILFGPDGRMRAGKEKKSTWFPNYSSIINLIFIFYRNFGNATSLVSSRRCVTLLLGAIFPRRSPPSAGEAYCRRGGIRNKFPSIIAHLNWKTMPRFSAEQLMFVFCFRGKYAWGNIL